MISEHKDFERRVVAEAFSPGTDIELAADPELWLAALKSVVKDIDAQKINREKEGTLDTASSEVWRLKSTVVKLKIEARIPYVHAMQRQAMVRLSSFEGAVKRHRAKRILNDDWDDVDEALWATCGLEIPSEGGSK